MDNELFELCKEVYERTEWEFVKESASTNRWWTADGYNIVSNRSSRYLMYPLYTSDYLLEKLPDEIDGRVLIVTGGDRPHAGYAERDNYGNYVLDDYFWNNAQYSNEVVKALLKLVIALDDAGVKL